jgi:adenine-specific DNA-methyltransferase
MVKAFRDTWNLGIHSYLTYLRDRLIVARELLTDTGSLFLQINEEHLHHVKEILDVVFGSATFCSLINVKKTSGASSPTAKTNALATVGDCLLWYAKDSNLVKYHQLHLHEPQQVDGLYKFLRVGPERRKFAPEEAARIFRLTYSCTR